MAVTLGEYYAKYIYLIFQINVYAEPECNTLCKVKKMCVLKLLVGKKLKCKAYF